MSEYCDGCKHYFGRIEGGSSNPRVSKWCTKYGIGVDYAVSTCKKNSGKVIEKSERK